MEAAHGDAAIVVIDVALRLGVMVVARVDVEETALAASSLLSSTNLHL